LLSLSCTRQSQPSQSNGWTGKTINILTLERIQTSGFLKRIIPTFEQSNKCKVSVTTCRGSSDLQDLIRNDKELRKFDLVLGLDNCTFTGEEDFARFGASKTLSKIKLNPIFYPEPAGKLIPYGYGYLALVFNETIIPQPPESFGELQDARFLNQLVVCDPRSSGIGRAVMYWTLALFGNEGFQQFWKSIKKNIRTSRETWAEALQSVNLGESGMVFGFTSTPAWILDTQPNPLPLRLSMMKEGSFLYVETAAIPTRAKHRALAEKFISYLLKADVQTNVIYSLGLFPANESTPLPASYSNAPFATYSVNDKLKAENPTANLNNWLDFWDKLFSNSIY